MTSRSEGSAGGRAGGDGHEGGGGHELEAVRALLRAVDRVWRALAVKAEMGIAEIVTLEQLHFISPTPVKLVVERTGLTPGGVTALIDRFEERELVRRIRPRENRRIVLVELTPAGRELTTALFTSLIELMDDTAAADPDIPGVEVRVRCLDYTAALLDQAATMTSSTTTPTP